jgi:DNA replication and repair protein RecF
VSNGILFSAGFQYLLPDVEIRLEYSAGFHEEGLLQQLVLAHQKDKERRYTEYGPHRADLRLKTALGDADTVLSRGQKNC